MLYNTKNRNTLNEIRTNTNPGVEYEIAMFYALLSGKNAEQKFVMSSIMQRDDYKKILEIIKITDTKTVLSELKSRGYYFCDVSFETQNDKIGPADLMLHLLKGGKPERIGLSIKYKNQNFHNPTSRYFLTDIQICYLRKLYTDIYLPKYRKYMRDTYGHASNWHRKRSPITDEFIDRMRDEVIKNWPNVKDKHSLFEQLLHSASPVPFWVIDYNSKGYTLQTTPLTINKSSANMISVAKHKKCYVAFVINKIILAKVQVKFNNGFIENFMNHKGVPKKKSADFNEDGLDFIMGDPFGSWDFTLGS